MEKWYREKTPEEIEKQKESVHLYREVRQESDDAVSLLRKIKKEDLDYDDLKKEVHEIADTILEKMVLKSPLVGAGHDGIVFKVNIEELSLDEKHLLQDDGINLDEDRALKIMKVYNPALGIREYSIQTEAAEILNDKEGLAKVPKPIILRDLEIGEETQEYLNKRGATLSGEMESIIMDYIDGDDLSTVFYNFVLTKLGYEEDDLKDMTFSQKYSEVANNLGFTLSEPYARDNRTALQNEARLTSYLKKEGFILDKETILKIENTISFLRQHKIYHNDLHGRNIMIDRNGEVFIIDFGRSSKGRKEKSSDLEFISIWKKLAGIEELNSHDQEVSEMDNLRVKLQENERWQNEVSDLRKNWSENKLKLYWHRSYQDKLKLDMFLTELKEVSEDKKLKKEIVDFLSKQSEENPMPYVRNKINRLLKSNYF